MEIRGQEVIGVKLTVEKIEKEKEEEAFESWVTGGYFEGDYIPYSFIEEGKIVFNVSANQVTLSDVLQRMGGEFHKCRPGFTPAQNDRYMCIAEYYNGSDDYRLFYLGQELKSIEQDKLYFPELSHA